MSFRAAYEKFRFRIEFGPIAGRARVPARRENLPRPKVYFRRGHNPSSTSVTIRQPPDEDAIPPASNQRLQKLADFLLRTAQD